MSRNGLLAFTALAILMLWGCESVDYKISYEPEYAETQTFLVKVPHSCASAKEKVNTVLRDSWIHISQDTQYRLTSAIQKYDGAEKGLLFKTRYIENLIYVFEFTQKDGDPLSCQVAIHGRVCERPDDALWKCEKIKDFSRAESRLVIIKRKYEKEAI